MFPSSEPGYLSRGVRMFEDRRAAGRMLALALLPYAGTDPVVLGVPRGGIPVADEVARTLEAELDVYVTRGTGVEIENQLRRYRAGRPAPYLRDRIAILVEDGILAVEPLRTAVRVLRNEGATTVVIASPVIAAGVAAELAHDANDVVCLHEPEHLPDAGVWYEDFRAVHEDEIVRTLERAAWERAVDRGLM